MSSEVFTEKEKDLLYSIILKKKVEGEQKIRWWERTIVENKQAMSIDEAMKILQDRKDKMNELIELNKKVSKI